MIQHVQIIHGDCMEAMALMKDKEFELAIVDPPYGIGLDFQFKCGYGESIHKKKEWNNSIPSPEYFKELYRVSNHQIIWGCNYYPGLITAVGRIVHDKLMDLEDSKIMFSEADLASCSLQKRIRVFRYLWSGNRQGKAINYKNEDNLSRGFESRIHPTQKPVALYQWLLKNYAKPGDKILDTHLGSGSSAIAADIMGFDFTGFEIDKDYYEAALDRFTRHKQQLVLAFAEAQS